jgi:membrane fusion protein (multidrug efflux system)
MNKYKIFYGFVVFFYLLKLTVKIWVVNAQQKAEFRPVKMGAWRGDQWFINSGLKNGEKIVINGGIKLRAGVQIIEVMAEKNSTL